MGKPLMKRAIGLAQTDPFHHTNSKQKLRSYFKLTWQLFSRPLKQLQLEYTPATSKGNPATPVFWRREAV